MSNTINHRDRPIDKVAVIAGFFARAHQPQSITPGIGPRFLPWQLEGTPEQSWTEYERHAENLRLLLGDLVKDEGGGMKDEAVDVASAIDESAVPYQTNLFGDPVQTDLFGDVVQSARKHRKKR